MMFECGSGVLIADGVSETDTPIREEKKQIITSLKHK